MKKKDLIPIALVKITRCKGRKSWYKNDIGRYFLVAEERSEPDDREETNEYWQVVKEVFGGGWEYTCFLIKRSECKIILE